MSNDKVPYPSTLYTYTIVILISTMRKALYLIALSIYAVLPSASHACSPAPNYPPTKTENLAQQDYGFIGSVTNISQDKSVLGEYRVTFSVAETLKGDLDNTEIVRLQSSSAACGYDDGYKTFTVGSVWAMYGRGNATDGYTSNSLSLNTQYASLEAAQAERVLVEEVATSVSVPEIDLRQGMSGAGVLQLQNILTTKNTGPAARALLGVGATGYFGVRTREALIEYQSANGIVPAAGYFGPLTRARLMGGVATDITFEGTISAVDTSCFVDATCSVTVDGKEVVLLTGMRPATVPVGTLRGVQSIGDLESRIGDQARVYAAPLVGEGADYTIYGNANYYVLVMNKQI